MIENKALFCFLHYRSIMRLLVCVNNLQVEENMRIIEVMIVREKKVSGWESGTYRTAVKLIEWHLQNISFSSRMTTICSVLSCSVPIFYQQGGCTDEIYRTNLDRVKRIWYLSPMRAAKVQASLHIHAVSPEPPLLAHTSSESRGTFRQKARSLAPLNGWACAVKVCHDGLLEDTNSLDGAHFLWRKKCILHLMMMTVAVMEFLWTAWGNECLNLPFSPMKSMDFVVLGHHDFVIDPFLISCSYLPLKFCPPFWSTALH